MIKVAGSVRDVADAALTNPVSFDAFLSKLSARDRVNIDRHLAACAENNDVEHTRLWKRMVCALSTLAPHAVQTVGQQSIQFFIPDGKYRMQVFALEDPRDGKLLLYVGDVLAKAIRGKILTGPAVADGEVHPYRIGGAATQNLSIESLTASNTLNPPEFYKHMLGWNRKALRVTLPIPSSPAQIEAAEQLCLLAAQQWIGRTPSA